MDERELEKTKPIKILSDIPETREGRYKEEQKEDSREEKYKNSLLEEEQRVVEEAAEEALAEKNIALAESYLNEENKGEEASEILEEKKNFVAKIKEKWNSLEKKQKIMVLVIALLLLILLIIFIVFLCTRKEEAKGPDKDPEVIEVAPTITDNYYYKDGKLYFIDASEKELGSYECENKDSKLCYVAYNSYRDGFDVPKLEDVTGDEKIGRMPIFDEKFVFVVDTKEEKDTAVKLYSIQEEKVTNTYKSAKAYDDNYIIVADQSNKYGLIELNSTFKEVIKPQYESLRMIDGEDNLIAKNKKSIVVINKNNKVLSSSFDTSYDIKNYNENFVVAYISGSYNVYDYKANLLASGYDYIALSGEYAALVDNKTVYVIDKDKNKYNEGSVILNNTNYVKTYIYDEDGNSKETRRSFDMNVKDSLIEFVIYGDSESPTYNNVELVEGKASQKFKYINYFTGSLYFYKDEEKMDLLGTYECTNKNYINKESDKFEYCFPAYDTIYEDNDMTNGKRETLTPLINEKYVFVTDGPSTVKLYDLEDGKVLGTYSSVNTNLASNSDFSKYSGKLDVIALNKKGKYGLLTIDGKSVSATYSFEYNRLEKLGEYILAQTTDNKWKIFYGNARESGEISDKIVGYSPNLKYLKTRAGNSYSVYSETGEKTSEDHYVYVDLYNDYYAAVDDDKNIYIYDYQGNKVTDTPVKANSTDYRSLDNPAFKVYKTNNTYNISVYDGSKYTVYQVKNVDKVEMPEDPNANNGGEASMS